MSFLNLEIDLCEQILAENDMAIPLYNVFDPDPLPVPSNASPVAVEEAAEETGAEAARRIESRGRWPARPQGIAVARGRLSTATLSISRVRWPRTNW